MNILERLLPKSGLAFIQHRTKSLTKWLAGIYDGMIAPIIPIQDQKFLDQFPTWTNKVSDWETATGILPKTGSRSVLEARFKAQGGQSPKYIQDTLRGAGFDVYVHEWWDPYTDATRNPLVFLSNGDGTVFKSQFGRVSSQFGNVSGSQFGSKLTQTGYALVNRPEQEPTVIPSDPNTHPYFMYVGGQIFPFPALVPLSRKSEFERLLLTICPAHLWIGILISYSAPPTEFITLEDDSGSLLLEDGGLIGLE